MPKSEANTKDTKINPLMDAMAAEWFTPELAAQLFLGKLDEFAMAVHAAAGGVPPELQQAIARASEAVFWLQQTRLAIRGMAEQTAAPAIQVVGAMPAGLESLIK